MTNLLLSKTQNPYTVFTSTANSRIVEMCEKQESNIWLSSDINLTHDARDWDKLNSEEQSFIKQILAFFAASDSIVNENIVLNYTTQVQIPEVRYFYYFQMMMEAVHSRTYSQLINTFISSNEERDLLFDSINNNKAIKKKADWCREWIDGDKPFYEKMIAFMAVEGIFFSGSFAAIFWLRDRGILANSLGVANEYISRDEALHCEFASVLINEYSGDEKPTNQTITKILTSALDLEKEFIDQAIPNRLFGMNKELMNQYLEFVCDTWLAELGCPKVYNVTQPFPFMATIGQMRKDNIFEKTRTNYARPTEAKEMEWDFI